jgi:hypothetical protein
MQSFYRTPIPQISLAQVSATSHETAMAGVLSNAIELMQSVSFFYKGEKRIVHPYLLGQHRETGVLNLRAYFSEGYTSVQPQSWLDRWRMYTLALIEEPEISDFIFADPDQLYYQYDFLDNPPTRSEKKYKIALRNQLDPGYHPEDSSFKNYICRIETHTIFDTIEFRSHPKYKMYFE